MTRKEKLIKSDDLEFAKYIRCPSDLNPLFICPNQMVQCTTCNICKKDWLNMEVGNATGKDNS